MLIVCSWNRDSDDTGNVSTCMAVATMVWHQLHRLPHGLRGEAGAEAKEGNEESQSECGKEGRLSSKEQGGGQ
jgi:hypothetical protein